MLIASKSVRVRGFILGGCAIFAGSCVLPWDAYDPRLEGSGGTSAQGGTGPGTGGGGDGGAPATGGDGGTAGESAGGSGGAPAVCAGATDGASCGSPSSSECDAPDTCQAELCVSNAAGDGASCSDCGSGFCDACDAGSCRSCAATPGALTTVFDSDGSADGIMFDVEALTKLRVTGLSLNLADGFSGPIEVYTNPGGGVGEEEDPNAWTLVFSTNVASEGPDTPTFMAMSGSEIALDAGERIGLYVTSTATAENAQRYLTQGTAAGETAEADASLEIKYGHRLEYPFTLLSAIKLWNGTVHYERCD